MMKRLAREEGILVGVSAAGAMVGSLLVAEQVERGSVVVAVCPDGADRYLSERLWEED
jgi:cysteine synthase B